MHIEGSPRNAFHVTPLAAGGISAQLIWPLDLSAGTVKIDVLSGAGTQARR
jgi:hypothetical protein